MASYVVIKEMTSEGYERVIVRERKESIQTEIKEKVEQLQTFIEGVMKGVKKLPKKRRKKHFYKLLKIVPITLIPLSLPLKTYASTIPQKIDIPLLENTEGLNILPSEIFQILVELISGSVIVGTLIAILLLMAAGGYKMIGQSEKARIWTIEIIKGYGQILLAPVVIIILVTLTSLFLGNVRGLDIFY